MISRATRYMFYIWFDCLKILEILVLMNLYINAERTESRQIECGNVAHE